MIVAGGHIDTAEVISLIAVGISLVTVGVVRLKRARPIPTRDHPTDRDSFTDSLLGSFHSAGGKRE